MILSLYRLGLNNRLLVTLFLLCVTLFAAVGLQRLSIDTGVDSLIPADDPARQVYQRVMGEFGTDNKTIIYVRDDDLWSVDKLTILEKLHRDLEKIKYVSRVDSLYSLNTIQGIDGKITSRPLLRQVPASQDEVWQAREYAMANPLYLGNFFSSDGDVTALIVSAVDIEDEQDFSIDLFNALEGVIGPLSSEFEHIAQVGPPRINAELKQSLTEDFRLLGPLSALILVLSILILMRSWISAVIPLVTSALSIIWTFGFLGWLGIPLNILSAMLPSLIIVIGSTEDTHMMAAYYRGLDASKEEPRRPAILYMAKHIGLPLILTVLTTALGFASNMFSSIGLIQHFAIAATFAMLANGIITILILPILLSFFGPVEGGSDEAQQHRQYLPDRIMRLFRYSQDHFPMPTLILTAVMCVFFLFQASRLYVTNDPLSYFPSDRPLIQDTQLIHKDLAGIKLFFISFESSQEKAFLKPENIKKLADTQTFLQRQQVFDKSISIADHLSFVNREFRGGYSETSLPESRQLIAQYLMFFHRSDLDNYVSHDYSRANIVVRHSVNDSHTLNKYIEELSDVVQQIAGADMNVEIVGENLMVNRAAESLMIAQVKALLLLLGLIFIIMSVMFTSLKGGAIALIPAIIPIAMMFGIMGYLDIPLNPGTAMVAVIAIGIAIDGTIHLLARYNELCRRTSDYVGAVNTAVREEATPLIVSSFALALGFGILLFSNFTVVAQFGALSAATMLFAIFANLLITPIVMSRIRLVGLYQILGMRVDRDVLEKSPLFKDMSNYQRRKAILISELNEFKAGELLVEQGSRGRDMYLIMSGDARVIRKDGIEQHELATLTAGQVFGEIGYIRETERTADVRALTDVSVLRFDYQRMEKDLKFFPNIVAKLNFNISVILGERLADMVEHSSNEKTG